MSRSYRTQKESVIAERRVARHPDGSVILPRVIECIPTPGDCHPLTKRTLARLLPKIPVEYLYGLSRIELRARHRPGVGEPFARYRVGSRDMLLVSLPPVWYCKPLDPYFRASYEKFNAIIEQEGEGFRISWRGPAALSLWFYCEIFTHELGHHFVEQYRAKNGRVGSARLEELVADLHARRFTDDLFASDRSGETAA
jgi:hypothetical protein